MTTNQPKRGRPNHPLTPNTHPPQPTKHQTPPPKLGGGWGVSLFLLLLFCLTAFQNNTLAGQLTAEQSELAVGDVVPLTLTVLHPAGYRLVPLAPGTYLGSL